MQLNKELILEAKKNNKAVAFKGIFNNLPTWSEFIGHIDHASKQKPINPRESDGSRMKDFGDIHFWERLLMSVEDAESFFPQTKEIIDEIGQIFEGVRPGSHTVVCFSTNEPGTGEHIDVPDVIFWQCIGSVTWNILDGSGDTFTLYPGDAIYIPGGILHRVDSNTPRASISFGL